jgi:hypothetical protein
MRNLLDPVQRSDVVEGVDAGGETAVKAEDLILDQGGEGKIVEEVGEVLPDVGIAVFAQTLVVEAVDLSDLAGLVVSSENGDALGIANFKSDKECDGFDRVVASVDVIT